MTTWRRIDDHGIPVTFSYEPDDRGNVTLTREEVEGLMRAGGWKPGPIPHAEEDPPMSTELDRAKERLAIYHAFDLDEVHCSEGCCGYCRCGEPYPCDARIFAEALDPTVKKNR